MHPQDRDRRRCDAWNPAGLPERGGTDEAELLDHLSREARKPVRHLTRDPQRLIVGELQRLTLLPLDVAGVADPADDALSLFFAQLAERTDDFHKRTRPQEFFEVEIVALHELGYR